MNIKQGDVFWLYLGEKHKNTHIQKGYRPCVVISNNFNNAFSKVCNIIPCTTKLKKVPCHTVVKINGKYNDALTEQIETIDQYRLCRKNFITHLKDEEIKEILNCICVQFNIKGGFNFE